MKHHLGCTVAVLTAIGGSLASVAQGQSNPPPCDMDDTPLDCAAMPSLNVGQHWSPPANQLNWQPNRLPIAIITLRPGSSAYCPAFSGNPRGLQSWWYVNDDDPAYAGNTPDAEAAFDALEARLNSAYQAGYRRVLLNLPAGHAIDNDLYGSSQFYAMPQWKRERLYCLINTWKISKPEMQIEIYGNFMLNGNRYSLCSEPSNAYSAPTIATDSQSCSGAGTWFYPCLGASPAREPSPYDQLDVCDFHDVIIRPWQSAGVTRVWLDWSTVFWDQFVEMAFCPLYYPTQGMGAKHFLGAEAIPLDGTGGIDIARSKYTPSIGFENYLKQFDADKEWDVSPHASTTEVATVINHVLPPPNETDYFQVQHMFGVLAWTQRGFVLVAQTPLYSQTLLPQEQVLANNFTEFMKRVYDFGLLSDRIDFNGDGVVNPQDLADFNTAWNLYKGKTPCNWVHGDVDQDNDVDQADKNKFTLWWNAPRPPGQQYPNPVVIHLGEADQMDALTK